MLGERGVGRVWGFICGGGKGEMAIKGGRRRGFMRQFTRFDRNGRREEKIASMGYQVIGGRDNMNGKEGGRLVGGEVG